MLKTPRRNVPSRASSSSRKRTLHLSSDTVRTLTEDDLAPVVGGSACPNGSWPTGAPLNTQIC
jgi:hypothetical protein